MKGEIQEAIEAAWLLKKRHEGNITTLIKSELESFHASTGLCPDSVEVTLHKVMQAGVVVDCKVNVEMKISL